MGGESKLRFSVGGRKASRGIILSWQADEGADYIRHGCNGTKIGH